MIRIITDSSSDLSQKYCDDNNVAMIPLAVNFGDKTYYDGVDISKDEFYDILEKSDVMPTTSLASPNRFVEEYNKYPDDDIIVLVIASGLSGTMQSAFIAKDEVNRDNITIIDSRQTTAGLALIIEHALNMINDGKSYSAIVSILEEDIPKVEIRAVIDTLKYLVKGGRLSKVSGAVGSVLSLKPVIQCFDGILNNVGKARGIKASAKLVGDYVLEHYDNTKPIKFVNSYSEDNLNILKQEYPMFKGELISLGPIVGTHIGKGAAGIAFFNKES